MWTYKRAGVDIDAGTRAAKQIGLIAKETFTPGVLGEIGGFGGLFAVPSGFREPVLVSGTDGVGTKLKLASLLGRYDTIGIDLVAMCVNDVLVSGARPLFFLDYIAAGQVVPERVAEIVKGIAAGCQRAGCALIGGETAELSDIYGKDEFDLAGFAVGIVEKSEIITGELVRPGDTVIGLTSSGLHSNGYTLARKILLSEFDLSGEVSGKQLGDILLTPTRIYVKPVLQLLAKMRSGIHGLIHITGGGLLDNPPRILGGRCDLVLHPASFPVHPVFQLIQECGEISDREMYRTFNMGVGMLIIVEPAAVKKAQQVLTDEGEEARVVGKVTEGSGVVHFA